MTAASMRSVLARRPVARAKVADLARIDHNQRQTGSGKLPRHHLLEAASRFEHNQLRDGCAKALD